MANAFASSNAAQYPTATTSITGVMMGLGSTMKITPTGSGRVKVTIYDWGRNNTTGGVTYCGINGRYGTGTAPSNGSATEAGSQLTDNNNLGSTAAGYTPFTLTAVISGLTLNTAYWFDLWIWTGNASDAAAIGVLSWRLEEF